MSLGLVSARQPGGSSARAVFSNGFRLSTAWAEAGLAVHVNQLLHAGAFALQN